MANSAPAPKRWPKKQFMVFGAFLVVCAIGGAIYWWQGRNHETTDDAFIEASIIEISPRIEGPVVAVRFTDYQAVKKGDLLVEIDPADYQRAVGQAQANLDAVTAQAQVAAADLAVTKASQGAGIEQAKGGLDQARHQVMQARATADAADSDAARAASDARRYADLARSDSASKQRAEQAEADARATNARMRAARQAATAAESAQAQAQARLEDANAAPQRVALKEAQVAMAKAQVEVAHAQLKQAQDNLAYTKIYAPAAGRIGKRTVQPGNVLARGQLLTNVVSDTPWVVANYKETQVARIRVGDKVQIRIDGVPGAKLSGHVDGIQPGSGARFSLLPAENATGNYVKVVQRIPVKIVFDALPDDIARRLVPGMSVVPDVEVSDSK